MKKNGSSTSVGSVVRDAKVDKPPVNYYQINRSEPKPETKPITASEAFLPVQVETTPPPKPVSDKKERPDYTAFHQYQLDRRVQRRGQGGDFMMIAQARPIDALPVTLAEHGSEESQINTSEVGDGGSSLDTPNIDKSKPQDKDYRAHLSEKRTSTFPVDLTRMIAQASHIPCITIDQINSQLEGLVKCQVESNMYGLHGRKILIPAGTQAIGKHKTISKAGLERFEIVWERLIRPDGAHIHLKDAYSSDAIGQTGVSGYVDNRMFDKYGAAIITASMSTIMQVAMSKSYENSDITNSVVDNFGTDLGQVTAAMLADTVNIKPFAVVRSGERIFIRPQSDIWLKETDDGELVFANANTQQIQ